MCGGKLALNSSYLIYQLNAVAGPYSCYIWSIVLYGAETWTLWKADGHFGKQIRSTWKVLKCGAGEGWRSVVQITWKMKKYYIGSLRVEYPIYNKKKANWIVHILGRNCLLKHVIEGKIEGGIEMMGRGEEDIIS